MLQYSLAKQNGRDWAVELRMKIHRRVACLKATLTIRSTAPSVGSSIRRPEKPVWVRWLRLLPLVSIQSSQSIIRILIACGLRGPAWQARAGGNCRLIIGSRNVLGSFLIPTAV